MSLVLPLVQAEKGTESRDRHSDDAVTPPPLSLSHTHTHNAQISAFKQSIANT